MIAWQGYIVIVGGFCKSQALFWINCAAGGNPYFGHKLLQLALLAHLVHAWELSDGIHLHIKSDTEGEKDFYLLRNCFICWDLQTKINIYFRKDVNDADAVQESGKCTLDLIQGESILSKNDLFSRSL